MKFTCKLAAVTLIMAGTLGACSMNNETGKAQNPLLDTTWTLVGIQSMDDSIGIATPAEGKTFTVRLTADGRVDVQADCNRGGGGYQHDGNSLEFGPMAVTKVYCGSESLDGRFLQELSFVRSYILNDGKLFMSTMSDGAILEFAVR